MNRSDPIERTKSALVTANRILGHEGVVDAYGHISVRHPGNPQRYFLSRSRSPELVDVDDIMEFDLDSVPVTGDERAPYAERFIHGEIYRKRADVNSVCHNHAHALIPFSITSTPIRPVFHFAAAIGAEVPCWDIRTQFGEFTNLLVTKPEHGCALAEALGAGRVCLMRGHGVVVATHDIKATVLVAISLLHNADILLRAQALGPATALSDGEIAALEKMIFGQLVLTRGWEYWSARAGRSE